MVDVILDAVPTLGPGLSAIFANVNATDFYPSNNPVRILGMDVQASDVCLVAVAWCEPFFPRRQLLESVELSP
jgi:hypothetical protein